MAEISRKSGKRTVEWINTKKSGKREVYDFYERFRKQLQSRGNVMSPKLDYGTTTKSRLVVELERFEEMEKETLRPYSHANLQKKYDKIREAISKSNKISYIEKMINAFDKRVAEAVKLKMPGVEDFFTTNDGDDSIRTGKSGRTEFKGIFAHDIVKEEIDRGRAPSGLYGWDDSQDFFDYLRERDFNESMVNLFNEEFNVDGYEEGTPEFADAMNDFLNDIAYYNNEILKLDAHDYMNLTNRKDYIDKLIEWLKTQQKGSM